MTSKLEKKITFSDCLSDNQILANSLFVLDQGDSQQIKLCADVGAYVLLPNFMMSPSLIIRTILRQARNKVVLSSTVWDSLKESFQTHLPDNWVPELVIYEHLN